MALSIGVQVSDQIDIDDKTLIIKGISHKSAVVCFNGGKHQVISEEERTLIAPEVYVSLGAAKKHSTQRCRLAFEAPRSIRIEKVDR